MEPTLKNRKRKVIRVERWLECSKCKKRLRNPCYRAGENSEYRIICKCSIWRKKWLGNDYKWLKYLDD